VAFGDRSPTKVHEPPAAREKEQMRYYRKVIPISFVILMTVFVIDGRLGNRTLKDLVTQRLFDNFGKAADGIYRSGQLEPFQFQLIHHFLQFKTVINLAWSPKEDEDDTEEQRFCRDNHINYYAFAWGASGPKNMAEVEQAYRLFETSPRPLIVHCQGGKDRTGGLIGIWKAKNGYSWDQITRDWSVHGLPASGWIRAIKKAYQNER
jgi:protein tyrosine phosphatase (PTP) superfamily phosphohydrolase (DUF442 family)